MHGRMPKTQNISHIMESWKEEQLAFYSTQIGIYQMIYTSEIDITGIPDTPPWWFGEGIYLVQKYDYFGYLFLSVTGVAIIISCHDIPPPQCQPWHHRFLPLHVHLPQSPASWGRGAPQLQISSFGQLSFEIEVGEVHHGSCMIYQLIPGNTEGSNLQSDTIWYNDWHIELESCSHLAGSALVFDGYKYCFGSSKLFQITSWLLISKIVKFVR